MSKLRTRLPFLITIIFVSLSAMDPSGMKEALGRGLTLWWSHIVPFLFIGLAMAELSAWLLESSFSQSVLSSLYSIPAIGVILTLQQKNSQSVDENTAYHQITLSNLYNPLIFPQSRSILLLDGCLGLVGFIMNRVTLPPATPGQAIKSTPQNFLVNAMNWTTIFGGAVLIAELIYQFLPFPPFLFVLEPVAAHWHGPLGPWTLIWLGLNGVIFWIPLFIAAHKLGLSPLRIMRLRIVQTLLALMLWTGLQAIIHGFVGDSAGVLG